MQKKIGIASIKASKSDFQNIIDQKKEIKRGRRGKKEKDMPVSKVWRRFLL